MKSDANSFLDSNDMQFNSHVKSIKTVCNLQFVLVASRFLSCDRNCNIQRSLWTWHFVDVDSASSHAWFACNSRASLSSNVAAQRNKKCRRDLMQWFELRRDWSLSLASSSHCVQVAQQCHKWHSFHSHSKTISKIAWNLISLRRLFRLATSHRKISHCWISHRYSRARRDF